MKTIEERAEEWDDKPGYWTKGCLIAMMTELAADLQAEHERSVNALNDTLSLNLGQLMEAQNRLAEKEKEVAELRKALEEKDAMSATIAQQDALLEEAKRVLAIARLDVCYMCCPAKPTDGRDWVHEEECESVRQLLTRLGGSHE